MEKKNIFILILKDDYAYNILNTISLGIIDWFNTLIVKFFDLLKKNNLKNILKRILTEFFITILFDTISKTNFREVLKNLTLFLNYTNYNGLWRFFNYIRTNNNNLIPDF